MGTYGGVKIPLIIVPEVHARTGKLNLTGEVPRYTPINLSQFEWAWLATQRTEIFQDLMDSPYDGEAIGRISEAIELTDLFMPGLVTNEKAHGIEKDSYDLTDLSFSELLSFYDGNRSAGSLLKIVFEKDCGLYRVDWNRPSESTEVERALEELIGEGWVRSVVTSSSLFTAIEPLLSPQDISDIVIGGARMFMVSNEAVLRPPKIIAASRANGEEAIVAKAQPVSEKKVDEPAPQEISEKIEKSDAPAIERGRKTAGRLLEFLKGMDPMGALKSPRVQKPPAKSPQHNANFILTSMVKLEPDHPTRVAFIGEIRRALIEHNSLFGFVNVIHALNVLHPKANFATLVSPEGLVDIVRPGDGLAFEKIKPQVASKLAYARQGSPVSNDISTFPPEILRYVSSGPDIATHGANELFPKLLYGGIEGSFPRMEIAIPWIVKQAADRLETTSNGVTVVEHSPGITPATMTVFARMGTKVRWRETDEAKRLETKFVLAQLPSEVQEKMEFIPGDVKEKPDVSIFNMSKRDVVLEAERESQFGGVVVAQYRRKETALQEALKVGYGWNYGINFAPTRGEYVLPSANLAMGISSNITFVMRHVI